ncbi:MAG TPA: radical SAM protein [Sulfurimonas sp.]|uniref:radical SAM/SPASM domain-containing protein n=1 Tax=Sulfurimonas sp. TaxID=2022749 RepID=UPI002C5030C6|nr:radical SAM protein [Sulfurimonas sp.]HUH42997.1 radical SAM protein [Sulfurimonas sp.]
MNNKFIYKFPEVIRIEPSATCNLSCIHCPTGSYGNPVKGNMSKELFLKIKDEISDKKIRVAVLYMGGEPFINKDFFFMVKELKKINIPFIKTVSNGMLLNSSIISDIIDSGLDSIEFSLDGTSSQINDFIRKNSNHKKVIENIKELLDQISFKSSNIKVSISSTQFKYFDENNHLKSPKSQWLEKEFKHYLDLGLLNINYVDAIEWSDMNIDKDIFDIVEDEEDKITNYCDHITSTITIRANGDIVPCCYDLTSQLIMGNVLDNSLEEIWNNSKYLKLRKSIYEENFYSICKKCSVVNKNRFLILKQNS